MIKRLQVGIIGTGKHGSRYAHHIVHDLSGLLKLEAICRKSKQQGSSQARQWACTFHHDWRQLIADKDVEAVIAVTTPNLNPFIAETCLKYSKPLLIEKPLATDKNTAQIIVERFRQAELELTVGQTLRYNSIIKAFKNELPKAGRLFSFCATHRLEPSNLPWLTEPNIAGGGVVFHTAVHLFDALRFITGNEVKKVRATTFQRFNPKLEDLFTAQIEMDNGLVGIVEASKVSQARSGRYEFVGANGILQGDQVHDTLEFCSGMNITPLPHRELAPAIIPLLHDWSLFIGGKRENPISGEDGLAAVAVCDACRESAEINDWVEV